MTLATAALGICIVASTAGTSIALVALLLGGLFSLPRLWHTEVWKEPVMLCGLVLFAYILGHSLWMGRTTGEGWTLPPLKIISKYRELWLAPVFLALFIVHQKREVFWKALLTGTLAYAGLHWVTVLAPSIAPPEWVASHRISASMGMLAVAWVALEQATISNRARLLRLASAVLALTVLFAMEGRTGHVLLPPMILLASWFYAPKRRRWAFAVVGLVLVLAGAATSNAVQSRMGDTLAVTKSLDETSTFTSSGIRRQFYTTGSDLARMHLWTGVGYGNIAAPYQELLRQQGATDPAKAAFANSPLSKAVNLHNEYLMQLAGGGMVGLVLFCIWLTAPVWARALNPPARRMLVGLVLLFAGGCLFNSWLFDLIEGHLYVLLLAWAHQTTNNPLPRDRTFKHP